MGRDCGVKWHAQPENQSQDDNSFYIVTPFISFFLIHMVHKLFSWFFLQRMRGQKCNIFHHSRWWRIQIWQFLQIPSIPMTLLFQSGILDISTGFFTSWCAFFAIIFKSTSSTFEFSFLTEKHLHWEYEKKLQKSAVKKREKNYGKFYGRNLFNLLKEIH